MHQSQIRPQIKQNTLSINTDIFSKSQNKCPHSKAWFLPVVSLVSLWVAVFLRGCSEVEVGQSRCQKLPCELLSKHFGHFVCWYKGSSWSTSWRCMFHFLGECPLLAWTDSYPSVLGTQHLPLDLLVLQPKEVIPAL